MRHTTSVLAILLGFGILAGCAHAPRGYQSAAVQDLQIVDPSELKDLTLQSREMAVNFGKGEDGTLIIQKFLEEAKAAGAIYVTDLSVNLVTSQDKQFQVWTTDITPQLEVTKREVKKYGSSTYKTRYVKKPVRKMVTEYETKWKTVRKPVQKTRTEYKTETYYATEYRGGKSQRVARTRRVPHTVRYTDYENKSEYERVRVTRYVTRYEYQYENEYVPPQLEKIMKTYTKWKLEEGEPVLTATLDNAPEPLEKPNFVKGMIYLPAE